MTLIPSYTVLNTAAVAQGTIDLLLGVANEAFRLWGLSLANNAELSVSIEVTTAVPSGRADGTWGNGTTLGTVNGHFLAVGAPAYELMTGTNVAGPGADVILRFHPDYLQNELYLDPTPQTRTDTPIDKTDGLSVLIHEIGHALGFTGYFDEATGTYAGNFSTSFDQRLVIDGADVFFNGPNVQAFYGAQVPLTDQNYTHYGNTNAWPGGTSDPLTGLMNGVVYYRGWSYTIGDLDLAFLADMGLGTTRDDILNAPGLTVMRGGAGNDTMTGSALDDTLYGDDHNDSLSGGDGNDTLLGGGHDDVLLGEAGDDYLIGDVGNDALSGGTGSNTLQGGDGNDSYTIVSATDSVIEFPNRGEDSIYTALPVLTMAANTERLVHTGVLPFVGIGNAGDNFINGGPARDDLFGRDGNDSLSDGGGGDGNEDTLIGGLGDDVYEVGVRGSSTIEGVGEGVDTVRTAFGIYALQANIENLVFIDNATHGAGVGNALDNDLSGGVGTDDLFGREGNDILRGGAGAANTLLGQEGDDLYYAYADGDSVIEFVGQGTDTVRTDRAVFTLAANVENLEFEGVGGFTGIGNNQDNVLIGGDGADFLSGMGGNDIIVAGYGNDTLVGGSGADSFHYSEMGNEGVDSIAGFSAAEDRIVFVLVENSQIQGVTMYFNGRPGVLADSNFSIIADPVTGLIEIDHDGNLGLWGYTPVASIGPGQLLSAANFFFL